ncbi:MAG: transcriptional repressor LexA [Bacteroidota bacterium]|jgi:repressor LexA|nr:transcriptional repressor LexA [Ignavibacteria bacterium]HEX2961982.1 transcriptional repressor LexA [Ignavibacteriales bacterium]MCU7500232.1 transcriptional repressor LexA [Ignavibacteria bacterium]MCU7511605.1 transcriptional repressor LexA [Ignavibacteria bacterium]MCU7522094.1 transcriptional repressor LexA [Ignavibacteria bacterium]
MKNKLTDRQEDILNFIQSYIDQNGYAPTLREIGKHFSISSTFGVKRHLDALSKKGYLNIGSNISRALSLTNLRTEEDYLKKPQPVTEEIFQGFRQVPVVGRVAAGMPILAVENIDGSVVIDSSVVKHSSGCFALKVKGDSMINAGIFEGDLIIISPKKDAVNGEIVVALLGDEATVKRFEKRGDEVFLIPENSSYPPIAVRHREDFSIVGKVVGVIRWYN